MMNPFRIFSIHCIIFVTIVLLIGCQPQPENRIYERQSPYSFEDTILNLDIAISEFNYRIIHRSDIGQAIRDRGDENFPLSTITSFCNITYAKEMMLINPVLINDMPCNIAVREDDKGAVIVSSKLMAENVADPAQQAFAQKINKNLKAIIEATTE
ncbi:DUF302 domain-containing protein [Methylophaga sp. OBS4]|uniref:DUF302 domain-containing protein n=1 Tax=Methylophaga sp. OBS4 TaxID=2991935 RepID=UPI0022553B34|nr:DUF302 domain-containing protein [Methylophaga sp. OBS4]MCX4188395.1 DUF302 domain-containing protein [Methylophaga sp. OBS4]